VAEPKLRNPVTRIAVRLAIGESRMAGTDDPVFLGIRGRCGREFRLGLAKGRVMRRGSEDQFVFAAAGDPAVNVDHPDLNDPTQPALEADAIESFYLRKGMEPIPNVRGLGEMDDRLQVAWVEVEVHAQGLAESLRFARRGPVWLGLLSGQLLEIPRADDGA
jgi:hypothetical protein